MSCTVVIDSRGCGTIGIADAIGEVRDYRVKLVARGLSFAAELTRTDSGNRYLVRFFGDGRGECDCPAEKYRKRGAEHCKHLLAMRSFRAYLEDLLEPMREKIHDGRHETI
jgi:hypothetical protein